MNLDPAASVHVPEEEASRVAELQVELEKSVEGARMLKRRLEAAERRATELASRQQQILSSHSWKLTAPLRRIRTLLGAPPAVDVSLGSPVGTLSVPDTRPKWDSLVPQELPDRALAFSPDEAARSNEVCEILRLDWMLEGLVPDALLGSTSPAIAQVARTEEPSYYGSLDSPPRIAFLGSVELGTELAFDAKVTHLAEAEWEAQLASGDFDFLLLEPVWHVGNQEWRNAMCASGRKRALLTRLLLKAGERGLPRVMWYRASTSDVGEFGWIAGQVDATYAIDADSADALRQHTGQSVSVLPPAIQPAMHNPLRSWEQLPGHGLAERVLFDGWLDLMEGASEDPLVKHFKQDRLLVAESEWEFGGVRLSDCPDFKRNAIGCISGAGKIAVGKMVGAEVYRQTPLVADWRRRTMMLRSIACGAIVADTAQTGEAWGGLPLRGKPEALVARVDQVLGDPLAHARLRHEAFREIFTHHCLADRLNRIAADLRLHVHFGRRPAKVACLLVTMRPQLLPACLERFRADRYPNKELVVVLHGRDASLDEARALIRPGEQISVFQLGKELSLGSCLNFAAAQSDAEYWAKFDDDDLYGPNYLSDIMLYRRAVDFPVGGKPAAFIYSEGDDEIRWDPKYASERSWQFRRPGRGERVHIAGGTLVGKRDVLESVSFSDTRRRGSDTDFLRRTDAAGFGFVAFDFFNFALYRSSVEGFHTWNAPLEQVRERTIAVGTRAEVPSVVHA